MTSLDMLELSRRVTQSTPSTDMLSDDKCRLELGNSNNLASDMNNNISEVKLNHSSPSAIINFEPSNKKDLEQRDVSLDSITTNNGTILNSYLSSSPSSNKCSTKSTVVNNIVQLDQKRTKEDETNEKNETPDTPIVNGACDQRDRNSSVPTEITDEKKDGDIDKQLPDQISNRTDEEKLCNNLDPPLSDEQKLISTIYPCNHCKLAQSQICNHLQTSTINGNRVCSKQTINETPISVQSEQNHENAISLIDLNGPMTREESEKDISLVSSVVKADYNIECQEFPAPESFPIHMNKTDNNENNENMQTNCEGEDVDVVSVGHLDKTPQFHKTTLENHSDFHISVSCEEIKSRSATEVDLGQCLSQPIGDQYWLMSSQSEAWMIRSFLVSGCVAIYR